jgi:N-acetylmuramoyl-L-alanine amidase
LSYVLKKNIANRANYGNRRSTSNIKYLVYHYTGNDGDSDENNGKYFHNNVVKASAHYFVDDDSVTQSVPDDFVAWSVGGRCQSVHHPLYKVCTNSNSISIEMCDTNKNGVVEITDATMANAIELGKAIMKRYNIPLDRVIRHYDVNGKACPNCNGLLDDNTWNAFKQRLNGATGDFPHTNTNTPVHTEKPHTTQNTHKNGYDEWVARLQRELNTQCHKGLVVDGLRGPKTLNACITVKKGARGNITKLIQERLNSVGFHISTDGIFGGSTEKAVKVFQKNRGLKADGIVGRNTWEWLLKGTKM